MVEIKYTLPPYTVFRQRNGWRAYYFCVPKNRCPEGWIPTQSLGRDDQTPLEEIIKKAKELKILLDKEREHKQLGIVKTTIIGSIPNIIDLYEESGFFKNLQPNTKRDYRTYLKEIVTWSGKAMHPHIKDFTTKALSKFFDQFEDTPEKQAQMKNVFSMLFKVAIREGYATANLAKEISFYTKKTRKRDIVLWTDEDVSKFTEQADLMGWGSIGTAVMIAYETGQRMNDILALQKPRDYKDGKFAFKQSKTGAMVSIEATEYLKPRLALIPDEQLLLVRHENTGMSWKMHTFCHRVRIIADACGMNDHIFKHLRHSARLKAERAGLTDEEMTKTFGWSRNTVKRMGDQHYGVNFDEETASAAVVKLNNYRSNKKGELNAAQNKS